MFDLHLAAQAAPVTIELPTAVSAAARVGAVLLAGIGALAGLCACFLHREIENNDEAHRELRADVKTVESDVKKLLEGDVAWVRALLDRAPRQEAQLQPTNGWRSHGC